MDKLFIPILLGTAREGRESEKVAVYVENYLKNNKSEELETELVDVHDYIVNMTVPSWERNEQSTKWAKIMSRADGLIIVSPEYNHGYPGDLKLMLDYLYDEYHKKPVGLCGVSSGNFGGTRLMENLIPVLKELHMVLIRNNVYFPQISDFFDERGQPKDEKFSENMEKMLKEFLWYAKVLKEGREKYPI